MLRDSAKNISEEADRNLSNKGQKLSTERLERLEISQC